ncbi:MAG TPA: NAD(P)H-dependent oxidoreductase [Anaerolineaceae bacterium]
MKITCISASNVENARHHSASTRTCELVRDLLLERYLPDAQVRIVRLLDYEFTPCRMCGNCFIGGECTQDPDFNAVFELLRASDAIFVVCPHYAPIPAKLTMLLEKLEEICYLNTCADPEYRFPLYAKPVGLIAHGGQTEEALPYYRRALLEPLANAFTGVQMRVIPLDAENPLGAVFGIQSITAQTDSIFVKTEHDWNAIRQRIDPLVCNVAAHLAEEAGLPRPPQLCSN